MGAQVPIGKRENQRLEFKSEEALRNPFSISREVVGMLNAEGGEIWVGVKEANGIAVEVEGIKEPERKRQDLLNHLLEVIEPRLRSEDFEVKPIPSDGKSLLLVAVRGIPDRGPFAQVKDGGRHFLIRVDHRNRPMTREEVFGSRGAPLDHRQVARLVELRDRVQSDKTPGLWLGVQPMPVSKIDLQSGALDLLLTDPTKSDNRDVGWNFRYPAILDIRPRLEKRSKSFGRKGHHRTAVWEDGCIEFWVPMEGLRHRTDSLKEIYPLALLEYSVSVMRLAKAIYVQVASSLPSDVLVDLAMLEAKGWHLPAYAPGTHGYRDPLHGSPMELEDGQFVRDPQRLAWSEFEEHPDRAGFLLVRALYQAFGLPEERIPRAYDRLAQRLVIEAG